MSKHRWDDLMARPVRRAEVTPGAPRWADLTAPSYPERPAGDRKVRNIKVPTAPVPSNLAPDMARRVMELPAHHRQMVRAEIVRRASSGAKNRGKPESLVWVDLFLTEIGAV
ncbi:hypothetical protein [Acidipropionibacterium acidipropionici]|uniref:hypothetical protein n=1 Tax=Acidipropionibacterium acidipropionici TaxID=1748 RepID=UPI00110A13EA|nr:hypothetical protein [Acidipropionibacterium acidipropionici]QCV95726.1 hypothetical protein FEZ30_11100 [Acidipropionibacterium acidipropionici]